MHASLINVQIGSSEKRLNDISPSWIKEQVFRRRHDGEIFCVRVVIESPPLLNMVLSTTNCDSGIGRSRRPNSQETKIFSLWERLGLNKPNFAVSNLVIFLRQILT